MKYLTKKAFGHMRERSDLNPDLVEIVRLLARLRADKDHLASLAASASRYDDLKSDRKSSKLSDN